MFFFQNKDANWIEKPNVTISCNFGHILLTGIQANILYGLVGRFHITQLLD